MIEPTKPDHFPKALIPYTGETPQEKIYKHFAKSILNQSFSTQFADFKAFHHFGEGEIIVLLGTSTAGKTSIIKALKQIEPERIEHGIDLACRQSCLDYIEFVYPEDYRFLQSV